MASAVAAELGIERLDGGSLFRAFAAERGLSLADFSALAERDPSVDVALDARLAARARAGDVVLESRLAGWVATNEGLAAMRVWLACDEAVRAGRVAARDGQPRADALAANRRREASERLRYRKYYGIDVDDLTIYDLVLDSGEQGPDELMSRVVGAVRYA